MLLRLLFLISLLGYASGPDARGGDEDEKIGGEGFGAVITVFVGLGALLLLALIVLAILAITGQFESGLMNPVT